MPQKRQLFGVRAEGKKVWEDADNANATRPDSITVSLLQDGAKMDDKTVTVSGPDWMFSFENLPKYYLDGDGNVQAHAYSVLEENVPGDYVSTISADGLTITNTFDPAANKLVSVSLEKRWNDAGSEGTRPESANVALLQNGREMQAIVLSGANGWKASVAGLPKLDRVGKPFEYTVQEAAVSGYTLTEQTWTQAPDGNSWLGTQTNTKAPTPAPPVPEPVDPEPKRLVGTGDGTELLSLVVLGLLAGGAALVARRRRI